MILAFVITLIFNLHNRSFPCCLGLVKADSFLKDVTFKEKKKKKNSDKSDKINQEGNSDKLSVISF